MCDLFKVFWYAIVICLFLLWIPSSLPGAGGRMQLEFYLDKNNLRTFSIILRTMTFVIPSKATLQL